MITLAIAPASIGQRQLAVAAVWIGQDAGDPLGSPAMIRRRLASIRATRPSEPQAMGRDADAKGRRRHSSRSRSRCAVLGNRLVWPTSASAERTAFAGFSTASLASRRVGCLTDRSLRKAYQIRTRPAVRTQWRSYLRLPPQANSSASLAARQAECSVSGAFLCNRSICLPPLLSIFAYHDVAANGHEPFHRGPSCDVRAAGRSPVSPAVSACWHQAPVVAGTLVVEDHGLRLTPRPLTWFQRSQVLHGDVDVGASPLGAGFNDSE